MATEGNDSYRLGMRSMHYYIVIWRTWVSNAAGTNSADCLMKDDEWGPSDILSMLPDEADAKILEPTRKESTAYPSLIEAQGCPTSKMEVPSEFGGYQPSLLSSSARRSPVAGRRKCSLSSRSKSAFFEEEPSDAVALIDLLTPEPNKRGNCGLSALRDPEGKGDCVVVTSSIATDPRKTTISLATLPLDHQLQAAKSLRGKSSQRLYCCDFELSSH